MEKRICEVWYNLVETIEFNENGVSSIDSIVYEGFFINRLYKSPLKTIVSLNERTFEHI